MANTKGHQMSPELEFAQLEIEAKANAKTHVANILQRPDQLDKVEHIRKRVTKKKSSVEAMLKTSIQSQLDGVKTGLSQLQNALKDIHDIKTNLGNLDSSYEEIRGLGGKLQDIREENSRHSQLAAACENLKHIFNVPETVTKCKEHITDNKLLHAHKCLSDLESSRDDLLFELSKQQHQSPTDRNTILNYYSEIEKLSEELGKQLWLVLQRTMMTARREPTIIVTVLRIIEREENVDIKCMKRYDVHGFLPPSRPKRWRQKAFKVWEGAVCAKIEGSQLDDRSTDKMWLVRHLEVLRMLVLEDLMVVKSLLDSCFPPHYDIVNKYLEMYHNGISQHLHDMIVQGLEGNEVVTLLTWVGEYHSSDFLGHRDLKLNTSELPPLLDPVLVNQLQNQYLQTMKTNFQEWMKNSLVSDTKDWNRDEEPDSDDKGYFHTSLPIILFQMIEQNLQVAASIKEELVQGAVNMCIDELANFVTFYAILGCPPVGLSVSELECSPQDWEVVVLNPVHIPVQGAVNMCIDELANLVTFYASSLNGYREKHMVNRSEPQFYLHYMIANINNCQTFADQVVLIGKEKSPHDIQRFSLVATRFHEMAFEMCDHILEEVFMDLNSHIHDILTRKWIATSISVDTICITVEDYHQDFVHLKDRYYDVLMSRIKAKITTEYLKAIFARKVTFKSYEERTPAAEKIIRESEQLKNIFTRLGAAPEEDSPFDAISLLAEMIKLRDTSMITFEISTIGTKYPDVKIDQLINTLMMREDLSRGEAKNKVIDALGDDHDIKAKPKKTIFSDMYVL